MPELYPGQREIVAGKLEHVRLLYAEREEQLKQATDPARRAEHLRWMAGATTEIAAYERQLATCDEETEDSERTESLRIRLSPGEKIRLQRQAEEAGLSVSAYIRKSLAL